jgi:hypothetical protein
MTAMFPLLLLLLLLGAERCNGNAGVHAARGGDGLRRHRGVAAELAGGGLRVLVRGVPAHRLRHAVPGPGVGQVRQGRLLLLRPQRHRLAPGLERLGRPVKDKVSSASTSIIVLFLPL